jgi:hypothetical protein
MAVFSPGRVTVSTTNTKIPVSTTSARNAPPAVTCRNEAGPQPLVPRPSSLLW